MEKGKKSSSDQAQPENDKQFLERSGASTQIQDVLCKILENRPSDPVVFLSEYFEALGDKVDRVSRATQQITSTHYTKPAFYNNVRIAYDNLSQTKVTMAVDRRVRAARKDPGKQVRGITGSTYMELLHLLCKSFQPAVREKLLRKVKCRDHEVVTFDIFRSAVFTCLVFKDFLSRASSLYESLDSQDSGKVDRVLCESITRQLSDAITNTTGEPATVLQAGYTLGPKKVHSTLTTALFRSGADKRSVTRDEFVTAAAETFLAKVRPLR